MKQNNQTNPVVIDLANKVAIVTGGDKGLGKGIVEVLSHCGAIVHIACRDVKNADAVVQGLTKLGRRSFSVELDVTEQDSVDAMIKKIIGQSGAIDILVNNAGVLGGADWGTREVENDEDWEMNYQVNLRGVARVTEAVAVSMKENKFGKIINISSNAGRGGNKRHIPSSYGATKAAVINLTQTNALDLAPFNINVNCVCPGLIWTSMLDTITTRLGSFDSSAKGLSQQAIYDSQIINRVPLGRAQTAEDIGYAVAFLASELAQNITGQSINVNGGIRMN